MRKMMRSHWLCFKNFCIEGSFTYFNENTGSRYCFMGMVSKHIHNFKWYIKMHMIGSENLKILEINGFIILIMVTPEIIRQSLIIRYKLCKTWMCRVFRFFLNIKMLNNIKRHSLPWFVKRKQMGECSANGIDLMFEILDVSWKSDRNSSCITWSWK